VNSRKTPLERALDLGFRHGRVPESLKKLGQYPLRSGRDARSLIDALQRLDRLAIDQRPAALGALCDLMQTVFSAEAYHLIEAEVLPTLAKQFVTCRRYTDIDLSRLLTALKVMVLYDWDPALRLIADSARDGLERDSDDWSTVLRAIPDSSSLGERLCRAFRGAIPVGHFSKALLELANHLAWDERLPEHPFDTDQGYDRLEQWLCNAEEDDGSLAHNAAEALHFVDGTVRHRLMALALDHPDERVQLEAAWASARAGSSAALKVLERFCVDVHTAHRAIAHLRQLNGDDAIPTEAQSPQFAAIAEASDFLQHPHIHGKRPDGLKPVDDRELFWPPAAELRHLWLFRFEYSDEPAGVVLLGGTAPRWLADADADWPIEDLYAWHCSLEAAVGDDPALHPVGPHTLQHGRALLGRMDRKS
jgi:hypothetical protein